MKAAWAWVLIAGVVEGIWPALAKYSWGLSDLAMWLVALFFSAFAVVLLNQGYKRGAPVGAGYAVWIGIGVAGTVIADLLLFSTPIGLPEAFFLMLIFGGVAGINTDPADAVEDGPDDPGQCQK